MQHYTLVDVVKLGSTGLFTEHYLALKEHLHSKGEKVDQVSGQRL